MATARRRRKDESREEQLACEERTFAEWLREWVHLERTTLAALERDAELGNGCLRWLLGSPSARLGHEYTRQLADAVGVPYAVVAHPYEPICAVLAADAERLQSRTSLPC